MTSDGQPPVPDPKVPDPKKDAGDGKPRASDEARTGEENRKGGEKKSPEQKAAAKEFARERKAEKKARRLLDPWERYRALNDTVESGQDLVDLADHKARFALIIMGGLNAAFFILGTRTSVLSELPAWLQPWIVGFLVTYGLLAVYFFMQAIESLRPRESLTNVAYPGEHALLDHPLGVRFYEDILDRDVEAYRRAWREIRVGQLNAELAIQAYALAGINRAKYKAVRRLYRGLQLMIVLGMGMGFLIGSGLYLAGPDEAALAAKTPKHAKKKATDLRIFGTPARFADIGAREPSGVAYHARTNHLFVVGDEGSLVELDMNGQVLQMHPVKGNLEDLTVHTPTGNLLLLSEKKSQLIWYDPVARAERGKWKMDRAALLGREPGDANSGFEGLAFREDLQQPGGGVFYLVHQRSPEMVVGIALDPASPSGPLRAEVVSRWPLAEKNTKAAVYVPSLDRMLVLSGKKGLVVLRMDGSVEAELPLAGDQQEGMCFDGQGNLWVADDRGKALLRFDGALKALSDHMRDAGDGSEAVPDVGRKGGA